MIWSQRILYYGTRVLARNEIKLGMVIPMIESQYRETKGTKYESV
jgi:hypothetical protein